ncbi:MAG: SLC13/DASS family transporter [Calditrichaeota bacterium]|nr:SLC13/DASS family transporter [Calditrichota bacterium]
MHYLSFLPATRGFWIGIIIFFLIIFLPNPENVSESSQNMAAVALLMAVWWMTETLPLGITALLPLVLYPLTSIMTTAEVAPNYTNHLVFLFMGGFFIALALQEWELHRRFALFTIALLGSRPRRIFLSFMLVSAFLSMWISNTATAIMMLPIATAVIVHMEQEGGKQSRFISRFAPVLMLGIAYSCSIGGITTLIGTPPNIIFMGIYNKFFPKAPELSFFRWMVFMIPLSVLLFISIWIFLGYGKIRKKDLPKSQPGQYFREKYRELGPLTKPQKWVLTVFIGTALMWIFRSDIHFGFITIRGWPAFLGLQGWVQDSTIAIAMAILLFIIHIRDESGTRPLLKLKNIFQIPWDILLLFGGGFALAEGIQTSGLADLIGNQLGFIGNFPLWPMLLIISLCIIFFTEFTSNTAVATTILPIMAVLAINLGLDPLLIMLPATVASSCAFMLPVATPPNAIIFGSRYISIQMMVRVGIWLNLLSTLIISSYFYLLFHFL